MNENLTDAILYEVKAERIRQTEKYGKQVHTPEEWLVIVMEEIGEMAQAMQKGSQAAKPSDADSLLTETIQAAAVLVASAEQLIAQVAAFEGCRTCPDLEHCATKGRLCEGVTIGDRGNGPEKV